MTATVKLPSAVHRYLALAEELGYTTDVREATVEDGLKSNWGAATHEGSPVYAAEVKRGTVRAVVTFTSDDRPRLYISEITGAVGRLRYGLHSWEEHKNVTEISRRLDELRFQRHGMDQDEQDAESNRRARADLDKLLTVALAQPERIRQMEREIMDSNYGLLYGIEWHAEGLAKLYGEERLYRALRDRATSAEDGLLTGAMVREIVTQCARDLLRSSEGRSTSSFHNATVEAKSRGLGGLLTSLRLVRFSPWRT